MAVLYTGNSTTGYLAVANNNTYITRGDEYLSNDGDGFRFGSTIGNNYRLFGHVIATFDGVSAVSGALANDVNVYEGASITGGSDGIELQGSSNRVTNSGLIIGEGDGGVQIFGVNGQIVNNGFVSGTTEAVATRGNGGSIFNYGTLNGLLSGNGVILAGDDSQLVNTGSISAGSVGVLLSGSGAVTNTGTITGDTAGVQFNLSQSSVAILINSGSITAFGQGATDHAVKGDNGDETVENTGLIQGSVELGDGNDSYDGRNGTVTDYVNGGNGSDTLLGGAEDNMLSGGADPDRVIGRDGDDTLSGGSGNDTVIGGSGHDVVTGGSGVDELRGGKGDDTLSSGKDNDTIFGGQGDDQLNGGPDNDILNGGRGNDTLTGGSGLDVFVFKRNSEDDLVTDFENGTDLLDVSHFGLSDFSQLSGARTYVNGNTILDWTVVGGDGQLIIQGISSGINGTDFIF